MLYYEAFAQTDVGKKRKQNEDSYILDKELHLFVIADGMGGHAAGEVASAQACQELKRVIGEQKTLLKQYQDGPNPANRKQIRQMLDKAINTANSAILRLANQNPAMRGMGTTLSCLLLLGRQGFIAHVGDSRIYLIRAGKIHQLTEDHSFANEYRKKQKQGQISEEDIEQSPYRKMLTRSVGIGSWLEVDLIDLELEQGDRFILTSDGVTDMLKDEDLLTQGKSGRIETIPEKLVNMANERGGHDNITTITIEVKSQASQINETPTLPTLPTQKINSLGAIPLFKKLSYTDLTQVANLLETREYSPNERIMSEGETGDCFCICVEGDLVVEKSNTAIARFGPGDYFGEMALVDNSPRSATVIAQQTSKILIMKRKDFLDLMRQNPNIAIKFLMNFTRVLTERLRKTTEYSIQAGKKAKK